MPNRKDAKTESLQQSGSLHPHPERVADPLFQEHEFFDRRDLVQVKYEMLRRVQQDGQSATEAARSFGFSRVALYQALRTFQRDGLPGLVRRRPGPKGAHKLSDAIVNFIEHALRENESLRSRELARMVRKKFRLSVHPRSIERALNKRRKKGRQRTARKEPLP
jgi:transposase